MTAQGRAIVAGLGLVLGAMLVVLGSIQRDAGPTTAGVGLIGPILGYVFGDRNGEKRLASAMTVLQADRVKTANDADAAQETAA